MFVKRFFYALTLPKEKEAQRGWISVNIET